jgi:hypothetical protein
MDPWRPETLQPRVTVAAAAVQGGRAAAAMGTTPAYRAQKAARLELQINPARKTRRPSWLLAMQQ